MNPPIQPKRLMIMAAGTGGHIFPGLAIAKVMQQRGWLVTWLGTERGMEGSIVPKHQIAMDLLDFAGMRGKDWQHTVAGAWKLILSCWRCWQLLKQRKPDVVLGMGGYVTVPGGLMAKLRGIPLVLTNSDAEVLLSNKALAHCAQRILFGFPTEFAMFGVAANRVQVTGNPVRDEIQQLPSPAQRFAGRAGPLKILVIGGSLGAQVLNQILPAALTLLPPEMRPIVTHQSGQQHLNTLQTAYQIVGVQAEVVAFIDDMASRYADADLVICRAGAITISELAAAGVASILVPLRLSSTAHQTSNANWMAKHHAALHLPQKEMTAEKLAQLLSAMKRSDCLALAEAAYALGQRHASQVISDVLVHIGTANQLGRK